jgi:hypothetical protein
MSATIDGAPLLAGAKFRLLAKWPPEPHSWCKLLLVCVTKADLLAVRPDLEEVIGADSWWRDENGAPCLLCGEAVYGSSGTYAPAPSYPLAAALVLTARFRAPQLDAEFKAMKDAERAAAKRRLEAETEANNAAFRAAEEAAARAARQRQPHDPAARLRELEQRLTDKLAALEGKPPG